MVFNRSLLPGRICAIAGHLFQGSHAAAGNRFQFETVSREAVFHKSNNLLEISVAGADTALFAEDIKGALQRAEELSDDVTDAIEGTL
jgi:hypothetical protein